ncbi:hypothetical protein BT69DRAFT_407471 [Atractiella rhizophila]|nr:hypothetical protein BT69DRAFT_407471 [Atractiella rhizophila]
MQAKVFATFVALSIAATVQGFVITKRQGIQLPPACPQTCLGNALSQTVASGACASNDYVCLCKNDNYLTMAITCFNSACSASDAQAGLTYGIEFCKSVGVDVNIPPGATVTGGATTGTPTTTSSSESSASTSAPAPTSTVSSQGGSGALSNKASMLLIGAVAAGVALM